MSLAQRLAQLDSELERRIQEASRGSGSGHNSGDGKSAAPTPARAVGRTATKPAPVASEQDLVVVEKVAAGENAGADGGKASPPHAGAAEVARVPAAPARATLAPPSTTATLLQSAPHPTDSQVTVREQSKAKVEEEDHFKVQGRGVARHYRGEILT